MLLVGYNLNFRMDYKTGKFVFACLFLLVSLLLFQQVYPHRPRSERAGQARRIISMSPSLTEILFELGEGKDLVGVTNYCVYPPEAAQIEKIGDFINPNFERILDLHPDVIFAERWSSSRIVSRLRDAGLGVVEVRTPRSINEIYGTILEVGRAISQENKALELTENMCLRIQKIQVRANRMQKHPSIYVEIDVPNWTVGGVSYTSEAIALCGARNIFEDVHKPALQASVETIFERDPDFILSFDAKASDFARRPGWAHLKAVHENKIIDDIGRNLLSHGNHRLILGMEQLQARLLNMQ
jgi:iron complex transport system substrate-binding protein